MDECQELILTMGTHHEWDLNSDFHSGMLSALPLSPGQSVLSSQTEFHFGFI